MDKLVPILENLVDDANLGKTGAVGCEVAKCYVAVGDLERAGETLNAVENGEAPALPLAEAYCSLIQRYIKDRRYSEYVFLSLRNRNSSNDILQGDEVV